MNCLPEHRAREEVEEEKEEERCSVNPLRSFIELSPGEEQAKSLTAYCPVSVCPIQRPPIDSSRVLMSSAMTD